MKDRNKIPKIIHYCWFGGKELPDKERKCIESWKKNLPDYEIRLWSEETFDVSSIPWTRTAYKLKKCSNLGIESVWWNLFRYRC